MTSEQLISELNVLFEEIIDEGTVNLTPSTTAKEVEGWDSLNHIQIIAAIEKKIRVSFYAGRNSVIQKCGRNGRFHSL